ncbi:MAG: tetratricopeptide repeat protein [Candidatus Sumerlaeia bacterium]|nr:tetratricopeptide repeat protein [Candidatus Sumerlaeia bacterium]
MRTNRLRHSLIAALLLAGPLSAEPATEAGPDAPAPEWLAPGAEQRVHAPAGFQLAPESAFPGGEPIVEDPVTAIARRSYVRGSLAANSGNPVRAFEEFKKAAETDPESEWLVLRAIDAALNLGNLDYSRTAAEEMLKHDPANTRAMLRMGSIAMTRERYKDAQRWYSDIVALEPANTEALIRLAQIAFEVDRDYEETAELTGRILVASPFNLQAMVWNAQSHALMGNVEQAADLYERLIGYRPSLVMQIADLSRRLLIQERVDDCIRLLERGIAMAPTAGPLRQMWEAIVQQKDGAEGLDAAYEKLARENADNLPVLELQAEYFWRTDKLVEVRALRERMLASDPGYVRALVDLARLDLKEGLLESAERRVELALQIGNDDPETYRLLGQDFLDLGYPERARALLERAVAVNPRDPEGHFLLGGLYEDRKLYDLAEEHLRAAIDNSPATARYLEGLGGFFERRSRLREASELYQQALAADPSNRQVALSLILLNYRLDQTDGIDRLARPFLADTAQDAVDFQMRLGITAQRFGDFERARHALERVVEKVPGLIPARYYLATTLVNLDRPDLAREVLEEGARWPGAKEAGRPEYLSYLADLYSMTGDTEKRIAALEELAELAPGDHFATRSLIGALVEAGRAREAERALREYLPAAERGEPVEAVLTRVEFEMARERTEQALEILTNALAEHPGSPEVRFQLAFASGKAKRSDLAEEHYRALIRLSGPDSEEDRYAALARNNLAYLFAKERRNLEEAETLAREALQLNPDAAFIMDTVGYIRYLRGDFDEARRLMERAARMSPRDPEVHSNLGDLYSAQGLFEQAQRSYDRAHALDPALEGLAEKRQAAASGVPASSSAP